MGQKVVKSIATTQDMWDELGRRGFNRSAIFEIGAHFALNGDKSKKRRGGF